VNADPAALLRAHFDSAFDSPDGIKKLRELILSLAMRGQLVPQDPKDEPASELLKKIEAEKRHLAKEGKIKEPKALPEIKPEEVPYELPAGWEWVRLGNISEYIQRGKGPAYSTIEQFPVVSQKCIQWSGFNPDVVRFIDPKSIIDYQEERFIRNGDLLWNSTGTGTIGRINKYSNELSRFEKVVTDSHVTIVRLIGISNDFILRFLSSPIIQEDLESTASGTTNQIELNTSTVINQPIPLPPLAEQKRIVAKVDELMKLCDELEAKRAAREAARTSFHGASLVTLLQAQDSSSLATSWTSLAKNFGELYTTKEKVAELRKAILQLAVMGRLVKQDPKDQPASELLKEIEAEKRRLVKEGKIKEPKALPEIIPEEIPYELPVGWEWVRLGEIGETNIGLTYSPSNVSSTSKGTPVLRSSNIQKGKLDLSDLLRVDMEISHNAIVRDGDLLICARNGSKALVGKTAEITGLPERMAFGAFMAIFRSRANRYLLLFINSPLFRKMIDEVNTMTINQITQGNLRSTMCPLPPLAEQGRIVAKVDELMKLSDELDAKIDAAEKKREGLLGAVMAAVG
jgi:type I restriction enzyme S subunit